MGFTSASLFGIIFGGFATGLIAPRVGQRACILGAYGKSLFHCSGFFLYGALLTGIQC